VTRESWSSRSAIWPLASRLARLTATRSQPGGILAIVAFGLAAVQCPVVLAPLPLLGLGNYMLWGLLLEEGALLRMMRETSGQYVGERFVGRNSLPLLVVGIVMFFPPGLRRPGYCTSCDDVLHGLPEPGSPECGVCHIGWERNGSSTAEESVCV